MTKIKLLKNNYKRKIINPLKKKNFYVCYNTA